MAVFVRSTEPRFGRSLDGRAEIVRQVVRYFEVGGATRLGEGEGQQGCRRRGWMLHRGFREGSEEQSVQGLESNVLGELLSAAGAGRGDTEAAWRWSPGSGCAHCGRSGRANSGGRAVGAGGRADLPLRFVRLPARTVGAGCGGRVPTSVLEIRLGDRFGHPEVLRQRVVGSHRQGGGGAHGPTVGVAVCEAVASMRRCSRPTGC